MKPHAQTSEELKNLGLFNSFEPWIIDTLSGTLFDNEEILHTFNSDLVCYSGTRLEKNELGYFTICTNERIIFIKKTSFSGVKSEIVLIKNIQSFETKSNKITIKLGERVMVVNISNQSFIRNFILILGHITAGRTITLQEIKLENEQYNAHLLQIKQQKAGKAMQEQKAFEEGMKKIVTHKSFKWWFPAVIILIIIISIPSKDDTKTEQPTQQYQISTPQNPYTYQGNTETVATPTEPEKPKTNTCKSQAQLQKELKRISGEALYTFCYNNFSIHINKAKVSQLIPAKEIEEVNRSYNECKTMSDNAGACCESIVEGMENFLKNKLNSFGMEQMNALKSECEELV